jgi:tRNA A-37 threonylcarbamoyl transferase component Bud32
MAIDTDTTQQMAPDFRLDQVVLEFLRAGENGTPPNRSEWLNRHPEFASELRAFFADMDRLQALAAPLLDPHGTWTDVASTVIYNGNEPRPGLELPARSAIFGDYELIDKVGEGGMGVVYKARQISLNRVVALKMIVGGSHARAADLARFRAEAEAVASLAHPNIVQIYEVGERDGVPYLSLEFLAGGALSNRLDGTPWQEHDAARLVEAVSRAMHEAHRLGIVHRDLKPGNILLAADGTPKVTDFGLAKRLDRTDSPTISGTILGTPSYMAPEQAAGVSGEITTSCDVYALGAILYELLTGRPPFRAAAPLDTVMQVLKDDPLPPRLFNPKLSRDLETICLKCLRKDRARRYGSALDLAEDLERFRTHQPIHARPISALGRLWRWCHRNPYRAALFSVLLVAGVVALGTGVWVNEVLRHDLAQTAAAQRTVRSALTRQVAERLDADLRQLSAIPRTMAATLEQRPDWNEQQLDRWMRGTLGTDPRLFGMAIGYERFAFDPAREDFAYYVYRADHGVKSKHLLPPEYKNYRDWDWYKGPLSSAKPVWSEPFVDVGGGNIPMITCSVPFRQRGQIAGVVTVDLSLGFFERLGQWLTELEMPQEDYAFVISRAGTFLMHPNPAFELPKKITDVAAFSADGPMADLTRRLLSDEKSGIAAAPDPDTGRPSTFYFARVPVTGWAVVVVDVDGE